MRYRYVTASGRGPAWEYAVITPENPLPQSTNVSADPGVGQATLTWKNPNDLRFFSSDIWENTTATFGTATKIISGYGGGLGELQSVIISPLSATTHYFWVVATDGALIAAIPAGPVSALVM
ncbi:MAG TPA: hypothetical protein VF463_19960 [Sphingobium sp.]